MTAESQGWHLKRLLSFTKNRLANRPNRPRDPLLRGYLASLGFVWPEPEEDSESIATTEDEGSDTESSDGEEGPVVPVVANGGGMYTPLQVHPNLCQPLALGWNQHTEIRVVYSCLNSMEMPVCRFFPIVW